MKTESPANYRVNSVAPITSPTLQALWLEGEPARLEELAAHCTFPWKFAALRP